jgi:hypothetical protein
VGEGVGIDGVAKSRPAARAELNWSRVIARVPRPGNEIKTMSDMRATSHVSDLSLFGNRIVGAEEHGALAIRLSGRRLLTDDSSLARSVWKISSGIWSVWAETRITGQRRATAPMSAFLVDCTQKLRHVVPLEWIAGGARLSEKSTRYSNHRL